MHFKTHNFSLTPPILFLELKKFNHCTEWVDSSDESREKFLILPPLFVQLTLKFAPIYSLTKSKIITRYYLLFLLNKMNSGYYLAPNKIHNLNVYFYIEVKTLNSFKVITLFPSLASLQRKGKQTLILHFSFLSLVPPVSQPQIPQTRVNLAWRLKD